MSEVINLSQGFDYEEPTKQPSYSHSVKCEETAKGVRISVHVYADSAEHARQEALKVYLGIVHDLQSHDVRLAPMSTTNGEVKS